MTGDLLVVVSTLTSLTQALANSALAAQTVSSILSKMQQDGRDKMTAEEWAVIDRFVQEQRARAVAA